MVLAAGWGAVDLAHPSAGDAVRSQPAASRPVPRFQTRSPLRQSSPGWARRPRSKTRQKF